MKAEKTQAVLISPKQDVIIKDIELQKSDSAELKLSWLISAVCNSERRRYNLTKSHEDDKSFIGGHEAVGRIEPEDDKALHYALLPHSNCITRNERAKCPACSNNVENLCSRMRHAGLDENTPSGFTKQMYVSPNQLFDLSKVDLDLAVFFEPLACVIHAWEKVKPQYNKFANTINIVGGGPIGCLHALYLNKVQTDNIIKIFEHNNERRVVLRQIFKNFKNITVHDDQSNDLGDITVMAASNNSAYEQSVHRTKLDGTVLLFSGFDDYSFIDNNFLPEIIHRHEFTHYAKNRIFVGSSGYARNDLQLSEALLRDFDDLRILVTGKVYGLESKEIHMPDGTKREYDEPIIIKDIKGHFYDHIKIQYFNNSLGN